MFDFSLRPEVEALVTRVRGFVDEVVIPREAEVAAQPQHLESIRAELQQAAREAGLFAPRSRRATTRRWRAVRCARPLP